MNLPPASATRRYSAQGSPNLPHPNAKQSHMMPHFQLPVGDYQCIQKPSKNLMSVNQRQFTSQPLARRDNFADPNASGTEMARYKTELCRPFEDFGQCRYGTKCQFAHGTAELRTLNRHPRYKTQLCRTFHKEGFCSYGRRCNFIHDEERAASQQRPQVLLVPITGVTAPLKVLPGDSSTSSGGSSPLQSPGYTVDEGYHSSSPTPSYGSDGGSVASSGSFPSPPGTPRQKSEQLLSSPLDLGFNLALLGQLNL